MHRNLQHLLPNINHTFKQITEKDLLALLRINVPNSCSVKGNKMLNELQNYATGVSANRIKLRCEYQKETLTNYRNSRVNLVMKAGPFLLTRFPRERVKLECLKETFIHLSKRNDTLQWSLAPFRSKKMFSCSF